MKRFVVIGLGRFGSAIAAALYNMGHEVLAIDKDEELVSDIADQVTQAVTVDIMDERELKQLGINNFDVAIVAIGANIQASILTTVILREMGVKHIIGKAQSELHARVLEKVGATRVVFPERDMAIRLANSLTQKNVLECIALSPKYSLLELKAPSAWIGKTIAKINIRSNYDATVIAVREEERSELIISPSAEHVVKSNDVIVLIGDVTRLEALKKLQ